MTLLVATAYRRAERGPGSGGFGVIASDHRTSVMDWVDGQPQTSTRSLAGKLWLAPDQPLAMGLTGMRRLPFDAACPVPALPREPGDHQLYQRTLDVAAFHLANGGPGAVLGALARRVVDTFDGWPPDFWSPLVDSGSASETTLVVMEHTAGVVTLREFVLPHVRGVEPTTHAGFRGVICAPPGLDDHWASPPRDSFIARYGAAHLDVDQVVDHVRRTVVDGLAEEARRFPARAAGGDAVEVAVVTAEGAWRVPDASEVAA